MPILHNREPEWENLSTSWIQLEKGSSLKFAIEASCQREWIRKKYTVGVCHYTRMDNPRSCHTKWCYTLRLRKRSGLCWQLQTLGQITSQFPHSLQFTFFRRFVFLHERLWIFKTSMSVWQWIKIIQLVQYFYTHCTCFLYTVKFLFMEPHLYSMFTHTQTHSSAQRTVEGLVNIFVELFTFCLFIFLLIIFFVGWL